MPLNLLIPAIMGEGLPLHINDGDVIYVLGANGTGKSSLIQHIAAAAAQGSGDVHWISAHRATWFQTSDLELTSQGWMQQQNNLRENYKRPKTRTGSSGVNRANVALYSLFNEINQLNSALAKAVRNADDETINELRSVPTPLETLNSILHCANIPITLFHDSKFSLMASRNGGTAYSASELSDGERNTLLIAADILTAPKSSLILLDEPERHLHRSIAVPLLNQLLDQRPDCSFIISTHELGLPTEGNKGSVILLRECSYLEANAVGWNADILSDRENIPEPIRRDIIGGKRTIIFIEGTHNSLDQPLYSLLFPNCSVIAKGSCRDVISTVDSINSSQDLTWLNAVGIIDNDRREKSDIETLATRSIFALPIHTVEAVYYHPKLQKHVSQNLSKAVGGNPIESVNKALEAAIIALKPHKDRLCARVSENVVRAELMSQLPNAAVIAQQQANLNITLDVKTIFANEKTRFEDAIERKDLATLVSRYPVRDTPVLNEISKNLGFRTRSDYERAVLTAIETNSDALNTVKELLSPAYNHILETQQFMRS